MSTQRKPDVLQREARQVLIERRMQRARGSREAAYWARELGKLWAEEALEEIARRLA